MYYYFKIAKWSFSFSYKIRLPRCICVDLCEFRIDLICFVTLNCLYPLAALWNMMGSCGKIPHQSCMHCVILFQCNVMLVYLIFFMPRSNIIVSCDS